MLTTQQGEVKMCSMKMFQYGDNTTRGSENVFNMLITEGEVKMCSTQLQTLYPGE